MKRPSDSKKLILLLLLMLLLICLGAGLFWVKNYQGKPVVSHHPQKNCWPENDQNQGNPFSTGFDGIDISAHQGKIHWDTLKAINPELQLIYIRARGKKAVDSLYGYNMKQAHSHGLKVGSYHFFNMEHTAEDQYRRFISMAAYEHQDLRPVIDIEDLSLATEGNEYLKDSVMKFSELLEKYFGCKPVIYSNQNFYRKRLSPWFDDYPLWIANYSRRPVLNGPIPILWQKGDIGHVRGIWTYVDLDVFINGGTIQDLLIPNPKTRPFAWGLQLDYFRPKSAGISPQTDVSHLMIGLR